MKIGIMADCHLGKRRFRKVNNLQNAYEDTTNKIFNEALNIFSENNIKDVIIAGDLFDNPNPNIKSILTANKIKNKDIRFYLIGGNHEYSASNKAIGFHPFDIFKEDNGNIISANYEPLVIYNELYDSSITMLPYKCLTSECFDQVYQGKIKNNNKKCNILVIHGYVDLNNELGKKDINECEYSDYLLPKEIAQNYDIVICGHIHLPNIIDTNNIKILTPGSIMPSQASFSLSNVPKPCIYILDTETKEIESIILKESPKIINKVTEDINSVLEDIGNNKYNNNLYFISYNGKAQDIDEYLYKSAAQKCLNLSIQTNNINELEKLNNREKISDFWTFIKDNHPNYYDEFRNLLKGES